MASKPTKRFQMTISKARGRIIAVWAIAILAYTAMFQLAPLVNKGVISDAQANAGMWKILGLVSPVVGTYLGFLFSAEKNKLRTGTFAKERWRAAFLVTIAYHVVMIFLVVRALFWHDYRGSEDGVGLGESSFEDLIGNVLQWGVYFSAFATAPVAFLIGDAKMELPHGTTMETEGDGNE